MKRGVVIAIIAAALVFAGGIALLTLIPEKEPENGTPLTPLPVREIGTLINVDYTEVDSIDMMPHERAAYSLKLDRTDPENTMINLDSEHAVFPGMQVVMFSIFSHATNIMHLTRITEDATAEQLSLYGFDSPIVNWRVNLTDGTSMEFSIGLRLATGNGNYIKSAENNDVFVLDEAAVRVLVMDITDIYDIFFFPYPPSGGEYETWDLIEHLTLKRPGEETIEFRWRDVEEWMSLPYGHTRYEMLQPFLGEGNELLIRTILLEPITHIVPESIIRINPPDLSFYGLDDPAHLTISTYNWVGTLLIGREDPEVRGRYIMIEGRDAVLLDPHGNYDFLDLDPAQLRAQMTWIHHIDSVSSLIFELDGVTRTLNIDHPADGSDEKLNGRLDGKEIGESNTRRLYAAVMSIPSGGGSDAQIPNQPPVYRFTMNFTDGRSQTLEFYSISESEYLMVLDNVSLETFTTRLQIQVNLLARFETLDAGGDLPMR